MNYRSCKTYVYVACILETITDNPGLRRKVIDASAEYPEACNDVAERDEHQEDLQEALEADADLKNLVKVSD